MGREVKRVPLDFDWPIKTVWKGFMMDREISSIACTACDQSGLSPLAKQLSNDWYDSDNFGVTWTYAYGIDPDGNPAERPPWRIIGTTKRWQYDLTQDEVEHLIAEGRLSGYTQQWINGQGWVDKPGAVMPTAAQVNRDMLYSAMGHDAINQWIVVRHRFKRLYPNETYHCPHCNGEGHTFRDDAHEAAYDAWTRTEPPEGEGWQMWETTSEGAPISPVFDTPERLAAWLYETNASSFGSNGASYSAWLQMIKGTGWTPSAVMTNGKMMSGVDAVVDASKATVVIFGNGRGPTGRPWSHTFEASFPGALQGDPEKGPRALEAWCRERRIHAVRRYEPNGMVMVRGTIADHAEASEFRIRWQ